MIRAMSSVTAKTILSNHISRGIPKTYCRAFKQACGYSQSTPTSASTLDFKHFYLSNQGHQIRKKSTAAAAIRKARYGKHQSTDEAGTLSFPSNLKIDPASTCSPFYGLDEISKEEIETKVDDVDKDQEDKGTSEDQNIEKEVEEDSVGEDEDILYSLKNTAFTEPSYVVPLPERLHVPIFSLFPDKNYETDENESSPTKVGTIHLSPHLFGEDPIRIDILHRVVIYQRNKKRGKRYPAITKTISTKSGSGKKMRPQKGTGRARAGHKRASHWRGGAKAHGPKGVVQDYTTKLNKKVRKMGLRHAFSQKLKEGNLILLNELRGESHKTKELARALELFDVGGKREETGATALLLDHTEDDAESVGGVNAVIKLASRNLKKIKLMNQLQSNVYDILKYDKLIMSLSALQALEKRLSM